MAKRLRALGLSTVTVRSETDPPRRWQTGRIISLGSFKPLATGVRHLVETEVGSLNLEKRTKSIHNEIEKLLSLAFEAGEGRVFVELEGSDVGHLDSRRHWVIPGDLQRYRPASGHLLSFNSPEHEDSGACPDCPGTGRSTTLNMDALVVKPNLSMHRGAFALWTEKITSTLIFSTRLLRGFAV